MHIWHKFVYFFKFKISLNESGGFGTRKMGDINSPSSCKDSLITPFPSSFSISLIKKDSSLEENFISIGLFSKENSSSQISNGIPETLERTSVSFVRFSHSEYRVAIEPADKRFTF